MSESEHRQKYFPPPKFPFSYSIFEAKDGDDCLKKTLTLSAYTGATGTTFALIAGLTSTTADNPALGSNILIRLTKYGLPMFAAGGMYAATTCVVANIRGKNDPFNHFFGGLAMGSVFGTAFKSQKLGWGIGFATGFLAMIWKAGKIEGFTNFDYSQYRREKTLGGHTRSYLTTRPNPEGDQRI
ncbi:NADH dehydrogenase [ubiquinone] 1 alpha subcomplex subunit 11-like [Babylonia areolata]|uniref:NADH dehydrogenase [ubiquinone] 1 alpha subcomplex subunit 11-like n=1 Tax=Babylonia areolata TaxID=304850 RepID=UPI003FD2D085